MHGTGVTLCQIPAGDYPSPRTPLTGTLGVSLWGRRPILSPSQTSGSYLRPTTRSFNALIPMKERVVGDLDVLGADLGAALGDVAVAQAEVVLGDLAPVRRVGRVHLEL